MVMYGRSLILVFCCFLFLGSARAMDLFPMMNEAQQAVFNDYAKAPRAAAVLANIDALKEVEKATHDALKPSENAETQALTFKGQTVSRDLLERSLQVIHELLVHQQKLLMILTYDRAKNIVEPPEKPKIDFTKPEPDTDYVKKRLQTPVVEELAPFIDEVLKEYKISNFMRDYLVKISFDLTSVEIEALAYHLSRVPGITNQSSRISMLRSRIDLLEAQDSLQKEALRLHNLILKKRPDSIQNLTDPSTLPPTLRCVRGVGSHS